MLMVALLLLVAAAGWGLGIALFILHAWAVLDREGSGPC